LTVSGPRRAARIPQTTRTFGAIVTLVALVVIASATLPPGGPRSTVPPPWLCLVCGPGGGVDVVLNVLLFIPLGVGLGMRGGSIRRATLLALLVSLSVESWQYFVVVGRDATISDLITNTTGGCIGAVISTTALAWLFPNRRRAAVLTVVAAAAVSGVLGSTALGLQPSIAPRLYYAQIEPRPTNPEPFSGRLLSTALNGHPVMYEGELQDADGAPWPVVVDDRVQLEVVLVPGPRVPRMTPIVRITNASWEAAALTQERDALVFRARTRAADARLRPPALGVAGVLPATPLASSDTIRAVGVLEKRGLRMNVTRGNTVRSYSLPFRVALGWSFFVPYFTVHYQHVVWISAVWLGGLLVPVGYWSRRAAVGARFAALAMVGIALVAAPLMANLSATSVVEWAGAAIGFGIGLCLATAIDRRYGNRGGDRSQPESRERDGIRATRYHTAEP
jgi:hypothetical protein